MGSPQNKAESPRTSRPSDRNSSALGAGSGIREFDWARQLEAQVGVFLQPALVIVEEAHGFGGFHAVGLDGLVNLSLHLPLQLVLVVLDGSEALDDGVALDDLFDIVAGGFVRFEEDVDLVDAAEQVVQVTHDVLVGAHQEEAEVIWLSVAVAGTPETAEER